jgi:hypothetical protein
MGEWMYRSTFCYLGSSWSYGQPHAPTAVPQEKEPPVSIEYEAGLAPRHGEEKIIDPTGTRTPTPVSIPAPYFTIILLN